jgi:predicted RND superfamily exporter protein
VVFSTTETDGLKAPERIRAMADVEDWLRAQPEVDYSLSYAATLAEMHAAFNGFAPEERPLPESRALVEQYLLFYGGRDLEDLVTTDFTRSRLLVALNVHGSRELNGFLRRLEAHLTAAPPGDLAWDTSGMARLFADQERLLIDGQVNSLYSVAALISVLMLLLWRQLRMAVTSLIPNFVPIIFLFGLMGVLGIWLDMATAMVASVAIGIAIDDTIHLLHGVQAQRERGRGPITAIARSVRHRGRALVATTLVLCAQFLLMALSPFQPTAVFGLLTALTLAMALLFDLLVLPAIALILLRGEKL